MKSIHILLEMEYGCVIIVSMKQNGKRIEIIEVAGDFVVASKPPERSIEGNGGGEAAFMQIVRDRLEDMGAGPFSTNTKPRLAHPVDDGDSGLVVVALGNKAKRRFKKALGEGSAGMEYMAVVYGNPREKVFEVAEPVGVGAGEKMEIRGKKKKDAATAFEVIEEFDGYSLLRARPRTLVRHQARLHLLHAGYPLVADPLYGGGRMFLLSSIKAGYRLKKGRVEKPVIERPALHASRLALPSEKGDPRSYDAEPPKDFAYLLKVMNKYRQE